MQINAVRVVVLLSVIAIAVLHDIRTRKIPNHLIVAGALLGLLSSMLPEAIGVAQSAGGMCIGLAMFLPMYAMRATGAGDVKLMAVAGSFLGTDATLIATLFTFMAGGVLALVYSAFAGVFRQTLRNLKVFICHSAVRLAGAHLPTADDMVLSKARLPYSLAIAGGVGTYLLMRFYFAGVIG